MNIAEEIKQGKFRNEYHKLLINLLYTANHFRGMSSCELKGSDISLEQYNVLRILRGQHPKYVNLNLITERMLDKSSNVSRLVEKLRQKGYVERNTCPDDRRAVNVLITKEGIELLKELDKAEEKWLQRLKTLDKKEAEELNSLLDKLRG